MLRKISIALILLCLLSSTACASDGEKFLSVKNVTIKSSGAELYIYIDYQLSPFTKIYLWLFGGKAIAPELLNSLHGFNDLGVLEIRDNGATLVSKNSVKEISGYYVFYGGKIDQPVNLVIDVSYGNAKHFENTKEIPPFWISK